MAKVVITKELERKINKEFKKESIKIFELMHSLKENPKKGKLIVPVGGIVIKELRYKSYRFYFITDEFNIKLLSNAKLDDLLIKFIRMSDKKNQQKVVDEVKYILKSFGKDVF